MKPLITAMVAGAQYLLHPQKLGTIEETIFPDALIPVTLLSTAELFGDLEGTLRMFDILDDVFTPEFADVLVEKPGGNDTNSTSARNTVTVDHTYRLAQAPEISAAALDDLPSGPYFLYGPNLYQAWKLYDDDLDAFEYGVIPENATNIDEFRIMSSLSEKGASKSIAVPSRLYLLPFRNEKPLIGMRIAIPDTLTLKGVPTTLSSRGWEDAYDFVAASTAEFVLKLIDLGAVIVGKTRVSQFTTGREWVDVSAPWNPRADGYQDSSWGSPGGAVAMAGYEWLALALGQETLDGVRNTAGVNGVYSLRSSIDISLDGVQHISPAYDALGFFFRDIANFQLIREEVFNKSSTSNDTAPKKFIYLHDFHIDQSDEQQKLTETFITTLENAYGIVTQKLTMGSVWKKNPPVEAKGASLQDYMEDAPFKSFCYEFFNKFDGFRRDYQADFDRKPFIEATTQFQWNIGKAVTEGEYNDYTARIKVFRAWFDKNIMSTTGSDTVMILPAGSTEPSYRDEAPTLAKSIRGITAELLAPILQTSQMLVPFAQLPYDSRISDRTEYRPVSASVMGAIGSDAMLLGVVRHAFEVAQWRTRIDTGRMTFPLADNPRNVDDSQVKKAGEPAPNTVQSEL